jgi:hypothetical protein
MSGGGMGTGGLGTGGMAMGGMGMGGGMGWSAGPTVTETPDRSDFMAIGHLLWMLLLGCLGARLAGWVDSHRVRRHGAETPAAPSTPSL